MRKGKQRRENYNIVVVGAGSSGKTCIIHKFLYDKFYEEYEPTTGDKFRKNFSINDHEYQVDIIDTAGQEATLAAARMFYQQIMDVKGRSSDVPFVLVGNKTDLEGMRSNSRSDGATFANQINGPFFETSAKDGTNIDSAFYELVRQIKQRKYNERKNMPMCRCTIS